MESGLEKLAAKPEYFGDEVLVALTRVSLVIEDLARVTWRRSDHATAATPIFYVKPLRARLDQLRKGFSPQLLQESRSRRIICCDTPFRLTTPTGMVLSLIYYAETLINEMALFHNTAAAYPPNIGAEGPVVYPIPPMNVPETTLSTYSSQAFLKPLNIPRLEMLHQCLEAVKSNIANFFSFSPERYPGMPFALMVHFSHANQVLYRLSILDEPDWDRNAVRQTADIITVLNEAANKMSLVNAAAGIVEDGAHPYIFTKGAAVLRNTITIWEASLAQHGVSGVDVSVGTAASNNATGNDIAFPGGDPMPMMMEFGNEAWLTDMFTSWDT